MSIQLMMVCSNFVEKLTKITNLFQSKTLVKIECTVLYGGKTYSCFMDEPSIFFFLFLKYCSHCCLSFYKQAPLDLYTIMLHFYGCTDHCSNLIHFYGCTDHCSNLILISFWLFRLGPWLSGNSGQSSWPVTQRPKRSGGLGPATI